MLSRTHHSSRPNPLGSQPTSTGSSGEIDPNEPRYCYCHQVSFGDMIACDGENVSEEKGLLLENVFIHYAFSVKENGFIILVLD